MMTLDRKGKTVVVPVTLKNREGKTGTVKREEKDAVSALGLELEDVEVNVLKKLELENGVKVKSLENGKVGKYTEMREGFIITHIDNKAVKSVKDVKSILSSKSSGDLITFEGIYPDFPREYIYALRF
jgi:hydrogenase maturation factor